jgi:hypothetical protein
MPDYHVEKPVVYYEIIKITADSPEEALDKVDADEGRKVGFEYSHSLHSIKDEWVVRDLETGDVYRRMGKRPITKVTKR